MSKRRPSTAGHNFSMRRRVRQEISKLTDRDVCEDVAPRAKVGRNEPCPCASGQKFKRCCVSR